MMRTGRNVWLCAVLLVLNILFIWGNSMMPGSVSAAISGWVRDILASIFSGGSKDPEGGHGLLRKLAHFAEFACLGALFAWLFSMLRKPVWLALLSGCLVGAVDEVIQLFVPDRGPSCLDVLIDTSGALLGIAILLAGHTLYQKKKSKYFLEEKQL